MAFGLSRSSPRHRAVVLPDQLRASRSRALVTAAGLILSISAISGLLVSAIFTQYTLTKWLLSVTAPLALLFLLLSKRPTTYVAVASVLMIPFSSLAMTVSGLEVRLVSPVLVVGTLIAYTSSRRATRNDDMLLRWPSRMPAMAGAALLLLLVPALTGSTPLAWSTQVLYVVCLAYILRRACLLDDRAGLYLAATLAVTGAIQGSLAIYEFQTGQPFNAYASAAARYTSSYFFNYEGEFRPAAAFTDPISLANVLAMILPFTVALAFSRERYVIRCFAVTCAGLTLAGLTLTFSRMSWVGAALGMAITLATAPPRRRLVQIGSLIGTSVAVLSAVVGLAGPQLLSRFQSITDPTATGVATAEGDRTRQEIWAATLDIFADRPLTGVGVGRLNDMLLDRVDFPNVFIHAHSTYFQYFAESGVLGGIALLGLLTVAATEWTGRALRSRGEDWLARGGAGAVAALGVAWLTDYTVRYTPVLLLMTVPFILLSATRATRATIGARRQADE